jgi:hypothetical protein
VLAPGVRPATATLVRSEVGDFAISLRPPATIERAGEQ